MRRIRNAFIILAIFGAVGAFAWYRWQRRAPGPLWEPSMETPDDGEGGEPPAVVVVAVETTVTVMPSLPAIDGEFEEMAAEDRLIEAIVALDQAEEAELLAEIELLEEVAELEAEIELIEELAEIEAEIELVEELAEIEAEIELLDEMTEEDLAEEEMAMEIATLVTAVAAAELSQAPTEEAAPPAEATYPWPWQQREGRARTEPASVEDVEMAAPSEVAPEAERWLWPWQRRGAEEVPGTAEAEVEAAAETAAAGAPPVTLVPDELVAEADRPNGKVLFDEGLPETRTDAPEVEAAGFDSPWQEAPAEAATAAEEAEGGYFVPDAPALEPDASPLADAAAVAAADELVEEVFSGLQDLTVVPEDLVAEAEAAATPPLSFDEGTMSPPQPEAGDEPKGGFRWPWQKAEAAAIVATQVGVPGTPDAPEAPETPAPPEPPAPADSGFKWPWQRKAEGDAAESGAAAEAETPSESAAPAGAEAAAAEETRRAEYREAEAPVPPTSAEWQDLPPEEASERPAATYFEEVPATAAPQAAASFPQPPPVQLVSGPPTESAAGDMPLTSVFDAALDDVRPDPVSAAAGRGAESYLDEGNVYFNVGQYGLAVERYTRAVEIDPNLTAGYYNRANARTRSGDYELALGDYNRAIELEPNDADALNNRGMLHLYRANYGAALRDFNTALTIDPSDTTVIVNRGLAHLHGGDSAAALVDFQEAAALDDTDAAAHYGAGQAAAALGNRDEALRRLRKALQVDPAYAREAAADPKLASLQGDAEFLRILREAGGRR